MSLCNKHDISYELKLCQYRISPISINFSVFFEMQQLKFFFIQFVVKVAVDRSQQYY